MSLDIVKSNEYIKDLLKLDKSFSLVRLGSFEIATKHLNEHVKFNVGNNAGIYNLKDSSYFDIYHKGIINSDGLFYLNAMLKNEQRLYVDKVPVLLHSRSAEAFHCMNAGCDEPWTKKLLGKKVLIISSHIDSFQTQMKNGFDANVFSSEQEFVWYRSYQTSAGNHVHSSWKETFDIMCNDISKLDFDIALLSCGGYGIPLCDYIKTSLKKSAIYIGGGLQLMFGVIGKRWENVDWLQSYLKQHNFIRPLDHEIPKNNQNVEGGCYW